MKYQTIEVPATDKFIIKGSKFIAHIIPTESAEIAEEALAKLRKKYYDATHNCFAWHILAKPSDLIRFSDDGEPSGTAGKPIFDMMGKYELRNVMLVVTRYFGGTKLGTGGLVRAYAEAAELAIKAAKILTIEKGVLLQCVCSYEHHPIILRELNHWHIIHLEQIFGETVILRAELEETDVSSVIESVFSLTAGKVSGVILP